MIASAAVPDDILFMKTGQEWGSGVWIENVNIVARVVKVIALAYLSLVGAHLTISDRPKG